MSVRHRRHPSPLVRSTRPDWNGPAIPRYGPVVQTPGTVSRTKGMPPLKKHLLSSSAAIAGATALIFALMPAGTASAHGYVSDPPSRQAQCAAGVVDCGPIRYEPQSVEGPQGLMQCSGGNEIFAELDDDDYGWDVTPVGTTATFEWIITANHATADWEYFIDGQLIDSFDGGGAQPPSRLSHQVDLSGYSGEHTVLARWTVADTTNAFYACVDVNIGGGDGGPVDPPPTEEPTDPPTEEPTDPTGECVADYRISSQWGGGFSGNVTVTAQEDINGWTVSWDSGGGTVAQAWNAIVSENDGRVTATNVGYNGTLSAGQSTSFGFTGANPPSGTPEVECAAS